jgi:hypothetical protein
LAQGSAPLSVSPDSARQSQTPSPPVEPATPGPQVKPLTNVAPFPEIHWTTLASGLELGFSQLPESREKGDTAVFVILRIDPTQHQFALGMASEVGQSRSLAEWSRQLNLNAGINASMYLPDNVTSTGYMRNGEIWNNEKIGSKLGAFFVAKRKNRAETQADIIERDTPGWGERLEDYAIVVQNYRLIDSRGKILWPPGGPMHSIAVVARDKRGRIDFILCQEPLTAERFAHYLKSLPLSISTTMYVEGGAQAGMFLQVEKDTATDIPAFFAGASSYATPEGTVHIWKGRHSLLNTAGNPDAPVPNILGIQKIQKSRPASLQ